LCDKKIIYIINPWKEMFTKDSIIKIKITGGLREEKKY
jgi:hypothetical protein